MGLTLVFQPIPTASTEGAKTPQICVFPFSGRTGQVWQNNQPEAQFCLKSNIEEGQEGTGKSREVEFLSAEIKRQGLSPCDLKILTEIIQCESGWEQFWPNGSVKISNGNIGLAQINYGAHYEEYEAMGLDVLNNPFHNIAYAVFLYAREGIRPWATWSGHCFLPKIQDCL